MTKTLADISGLPPWFLSHAFQLSVLIVLSSLILFSHLNEGGLSGYDDALYAHEGRQMLITGDWWNVRDNGVLNFEYPPMFIWLEALSMKVWGVSDFAAKFPVALSGLLTIVLVFCIARELFSDFWTPVAAGWILMLTQYFLKYSMHAMTDVPFTLFFTFAIYCYLKGLRRPAFFLLCGVAIACAILTRSILGVLPGIIIVSHFALTKHYRLMWTPMFLCGMLTAAAIPLFWYVTEYRLYNGDFTT